jgi:MFS family permease
MPERDSPPSGYQNEFSDSLARPGRVLDNPAVHQRFYGPDESATGPSRFRFDPRGAKPTAGDRTQPLAKYSRYRNRAVWAQALVLFNVVGIPLSQGVYLEYYYNAALPTSSVVALSVIPALQILFTLATPILVGWFYHRRGQRSGWRLVFLGAAVVAICAQLPLQWLKSYVLTVILQGLLLGIALGTLFTLSTLVLSSHYRFNLPLVSTQSGFFGFLGAVVYSIIARQGLGADKKGFFAPAATAGLLAATLLIANLLIRQVKPDGAQAGQKTNKLDMELPKGIGKVAKEKGTIPFILGYFLVFFGIFIFPIYIVLLLSQQQTPDIGYWPLLTTLTVSALSACISAQSAVHRRLGPVNTFIVASVVAGAVSILPAWMPIPWLAILAGGAYGLGLGAIIALHIKVTTVFHAEKVVWHPDMPARAAIMMAVGGVSAFAGILVSAVLMEQMKSGAKIASAVAVGCLVGGGALVAVGRWKRCGRFGVAI